MNLDKRIVSECNTNLDSFITERFGISKDTYYVLFNGKKVDISNVEPQIFEGVVHIVPRTYGGKGGFGSMLRAIGAQIEKTTNREACRDLSGRRLRDINEEQRLKNWIAQQADREREAAERKKKKLERLCQEPKHEFKDDEYEDSRSALCEKMSSSVDQGIKATTNGINKSKRKQNFDKTLYKTKNKKKKLWIDGESSGYSSTDESETYEIGQK